VIISAEGLDKPSLHVDLLASAMHAFETTIVITYRRYHEWIGSVHGEVWWGISLRVHTLKIAICCARRDLQVPYCGKRQSLGMGAEAMKRYAYTSRAARPTPTLLHPVGRYTPLIDFLTMDLISEGMRSCSANGSSYSLSVRNRYDKSFPAAKLKILNLHDTATHCGLV